MFKHSSDLSKDITCTGSKTKFLILQPGSCSSLHFISLHGLTADLKKSVFLCTVIIQLPHEACLLKVLFEKKNKLERIKAGPTVANKPVHSCH